MTTTTTTTITMTHFKLSANFNADDDNDCWVMPAPSGRNFGQFEEKTLVSNKSARKRIDAICQHGGFTQNWDNFPDPENRNLSIMDKIPVIILVMLMLGLEDEAIVNALKGGYAICMHPDKRTCMNVITGRHKNSQGKWSLDKFCLYYPNNEIAYRLWGKNWPLLNGYSFRTAVLNGNLNRGDLKGLRQGTIPTQAGTQFYKDYFKLVIDNESEYEDCAYMNLNLEETPVIQEIKIEAMVMAMIKAYGGETGILAPSYDPDEQGMTALQSEWELMKRLI
jgi:hypothetical protein